MSSFWILMELRMMEVEVTTGTVRRAKLQTNRNHQQTNTQIVTGRMPFLSPNQQRQHNVTVNGLAHPSSTGVLRPLFDH